jgi:hypothetical protein
MTCGFCCVRYLRGHRGPILLAVFMPPKYRRQTLKLRGTAHRRRPKKGTTPCVNREPPVP